MSDFLDTLRTNRDTLLDATRVGNLDVLRTLLGPAWRGFVKKVASRTPATEVDSRYGVVFDWTYRRDHPELGKLYTQAKENQWDAEKALDWSADLTPRDEPDWLLPDELVGFKDLEAVRKASPRERTAMKLGYLAWMLSQFLHGEQGALFAAAQVTTAVSWLDGKLY